LDSDGVVEWEEVGSKVSFVFGDEEVSCDAADGTWDTYRSEFLGVVGVFVEGYKVDGVDVVAFVVAEVCVSNVGKEGCEVLCGGGGGCLFVMGGYSFGDKACEHVKGVALYTKGLSFWEISDAFDDFIRSEGNWACVDLGSGSWKYWFISEFWGMKLLADVDVFWGVWSNGGGFE
jgi:hypothetical protein